MSQFGMTPISILDKSPMGGFRGGMADQRSLMHSDSNLMTETLAQEAQKMQNETTQLNRPVDAVKRAAELAKLEEEMVLRQQGHYRDLSNTDLQTKKEDLAGKMDENTRKRTLAAAEGALHASSVFSPDDDDATRASKWGTAVQIAKAAGLSNIPDDYSEYNYQRLMERAKAAPSAIQQMKAIELKGVEAGHRMKEVEVKEAGDTARNAASNATSEANSKRSAWATMQAAKERANSGEVYLRTEKERLLQTLEVANRGDKTISAGTYQQLESIADSYAAEMVIKDKAAIAAAANEASRTGKPVEQARAAKEADLREQYKRQFMSRADGLKIQTDTGIAAVIEGGKPTPTKAAPVTQKEVSSGDKYIKGKIYTDPVSKKSAEYLGDGKWGPAK